MISSFIPVALVQQISLFTTADEGIANVNDDSSEGEMIDKGETSRSNDSKEESNSVRNKDKSNLNSSAMPSLGKRKLPMRMAKSAGNKKRIFQKKETSIVKSPDKVLKGNINTCLACPGDKYFLVPTMCFFRKKGLEFFVASQAEVQEREDMGKPIPAGSVGLRCVYCRDVPQNLKTARWQSFPSATGRIYNALLKYQQFHFESCSNVPKSVRLEYNRLKSSSCGARLRKPSEYCAKTAQRVGLRDGDFGCIILSKECNVLENDAVEDLHGSLIVDGKPSVSGKELFVEKFDREIVSDFVRLIMMQFEVTCFDDSYYLERRGTHIRDGVPGLSCKHCVGTSTEFRFFSPSCTHLRESYESILYEHLKQCEHCPQEVKKELFNAKIVHSEQSSKHEDWFIIQFFDRVWVRMFQKAIMDKIPNLDTYVHEKVVPLSTKEDPSIFESLDCAVRSNIEVFAATLDDVTQLSNIRIETMVIPGRVGLRCRKCAAYGLVNHIVFPESVKDLCQCARSFHRSHVMNCPSMVKDKGSQSSGDRETFDRKPQTFDNYEQTARSMGLENSVICGIRFRGNDDRAVLRSVIDEDPTSINQEEKETKNVEEVFEITHKTNEMLKKIKTSDLPTDAVYLPGDAKYCTDFKLLLLHCMKSLRFREEDRTTSSRRKIRIGHHGLGCRYCGSCTAFPSSSKAIIRNIIPNMFIHIKKDCRKVPNCLREAIFAHRSTNDEQLFERPPCSQTILSKRIFKKIYSDSKVDNKS